MRARVDPEVRQGSANLRPDPVAPMSRDVVGGGVHREVARGPHPLRREPRALGQPKR
jgi:hypothetical protein